MQILPNLAGSPSLEKLGKSLVRFLAIKDTYHSFYFLKVSKTYLSSLAFLVSIINSTYGRGVE